MNDSPLELPKSPSRRTCEGRKSVKDYFRYFEPFLHRIHALRPLRIDDGPMAKNAGSVCLATPPKWALASHGRAGANGRVDAPQSHPRTAGKRSTSFRYRYNPGSPLLQTGTTAPLFSGCDMRFPAMAAFELLVTPSHRHGSSTSILRCTSTVAGAGAAPQIRESDDRKPYGSPSDRHHFWRHRLRVRAPGSLTPPSLANSDIAFH